MNRLVHILSIITGCILLLFSSGCEKVIEINIEGVEKKYVIEGWVTDEDNSYRVIISQTMDVNDFNIFKPVENAEVTITEDGTRAVQLKYDPDNRYYAANEKGMSGKKYDLNVKIGSQTYTASSIMPPKVEWDSIYVSKRFFLGKTRLIPTVSLKDPVGLGNAYRFTKYKNGSKDNTIFVLDDKLIDGNNFKYELLSFTTDDEMYLEEEDQLRIEMRCIDNANFKYWYSLSQASLGSSQSASPGNPPTNIKGGALGYFTACTYQEDNIAVRSESSITGNK